MQTTHQRCGGAVPLEEDYKSKIENWYYARPVYVKVAHEHAMFGAALTKWHMNMPCLALF